MKVFYQQSASIEFDDDCVDVQCKNGASIKISPQKNGAKDDVIATGWNVTVEEQYCQVYGIWICSILAHLHAWTYQTLPIL